MPQIKSNNYKHPESNIYILKQLEPNRGKQNSSKIQDTRKATLQYCTWLIKAAFSWIEVMANVNWLPYWRNQNSTAWEKTKKKNVFEGAGTEVLCLQMVWNRVLVLEWTLYNWQGAKSITYGTLHDNTQGKVSGSQRSLPLSALLRLDRHQGQMKKKKGGVGGRHWGFLSLRQNNHSRSARGNTCFVGMLWHIYEEPEKECVVKKNCTQCT